MREEIDSDRRRFLGAAVTTTLQGREVDAPAYVTVGE